LLDRSSHHSVGAGAALNTKVLQLIAIRCVDSADTQNKHKGSEFVNHHLYYPQLSVTRRLGLYLSAKISIRNFIAKAVLTGGRLSDSRILILSQQYYVSE